MHFQFSKQNMKKTINKADTIINILHHMLNDVCNIAHMHTFFLCDDYEIQLGLHKIIKSLIG